VSDAIPVLTDRKSLLSEDSLLERVIAAAEERQLSIHSTIVCREQIEDLEDGNTIFSSKIPGNTAHVHKRCDDQAREHGYDNWHDLSFDVIYLLRRYGWLSPEGDVTEKFLRSWKRAEHFDGL
jgi:hypothetical protein